MQNTPYRVVPLKKQSLLQWVFKQEPQENAVIELNNCLASKPITEIRKEEIEDIQTRYSIRIANEFVLNLQEFYAVYLNYCLQDKHLSEAEIQDLQHLKKLFSFSDRTVQTLHQKVGKSVYNEAYHEAVADGRLSKEEEQFLKQLEEQLYLPTEIAQKISGEARETYMNRFVAEIIKDEKISPEEEKELQAIAKSLNIDLKLEGSSKEVFEKYKNYWALENLPLPEVDCDIKLYKEEKCHLYLPEMYWFELRSDRSSTYSTYLHGEEYLGFLPVTPIGKEYRLIDEGELYLTDKRLIFVGMSKTTTIRLQKILESDPNYKALEITKDSGRNPVLCGKDIRPLGIILNRLLIQ